MTETTGKKQYKTPEDSLAELQVVLDKYTESIGLVTTTKPETSKILSLSTDEIKSLNYEECTLNAYVLAHASLHVQSEINKFQMILNWANTNLLSMACSVIDQYGDSFVKTEVKVMRFIRDNPVAERLHKLKVEAQQKLDTLSYLPSHIDFMAKILLESAKTKRYKDG